LANRKRDFVHDFAGIVLCQNAMSVFVEFGVVPASRCPRDEAMHARVAFFRRF
jgi:hypothetical protein